MRILLTILFIALTFQSAEAQQVWGELGRVSTTFDYEDSDGAAIENLSSSTHFSYAAGYRKIMKGRLFWHAGLTFNRFGMVGSDPLYDNQYSWDLSYIGPTGGLDMELFRKKAFRFYARIAAEPQFMIKGRQQINNQYYDLKGVEQFDRPFLFAKGGFGINYCADQMVAVTLRYQYGKGFPIGKTEDTELLRLNTHTISLGVLISLKFCSYCYKKHFEKSE
jgi:hypothetical protein